jgi:inosose dehydratase
LENIVKKLKDNGLESRSIYISGNLHDSKVAAREFSRLRTVSEKAKELGSEYAVFNPAAKRGKSDAELKLQTGNVDKLGAELAAIGIKLAFHYHTVELEFAGREFYHLLNNTDPKNLSLCLEQHWSYRGAGNSQIALLEYPRSQLVRETWLNLNGFWDYAITHRDAVKPEKSDGKILVPYPVESALSGVKGNWINEGRLF